MVKPIKHYRNLFDNIDNINAWEVTTGAGGVVAF